MRQCLTVFFLCYSVQLFSQPFITDNPSVGFSNCNICKIRQVIVDKDYTKILLEIKAQSKGQTLVSISPWTALLPYESTEQVADLRKLDIEIPDPTSADPTYLSLWRDLANQRKAMQSQVIGSGVNLITRLEDGELGSVYSIKSKEPNKVFHFWLKFQPIPMGIDELLMIELAENGWEFARIKITNPDTSPKTKWTEETIKADWLKNGINYIEGIYEKAMADNSSPKYRVAVKKNESDNDYTLIYLSGTESKLWKVGDIKAKLILTGSENLYKTIWYMGNKSTVDDIYTSFEKGMMKLLWTDSRPEELYIKLYPTATTDYSSSNNISSSGTGFALSENGFIATNHHVVQGAKNVKVRGIKGDFSRTYEAKIVIEDKNNDIAIIKIVDSKFTSLGNPPYRINTGIADVGTSVYALGYPLRASMGDEVKLTNGIVSSKTGYQGDITAYQVSVPVQPGNSGGPLFDSKGNVIGLINAKHTGAENASYAVKTTYLINLIQTMNDAPTLPANNTIASKGLSDQVKFVKEFVYIIEIN